MVFKISLMEVNIAIYLATKDHQVSLQQEIHMKKGTMYVKDTHTNKSILITADEYNKNKHLYIHPGESTVEYKTVTCPHCGKSGKENAMMRWHFDNCSKIKSPEILTCPHCGISKRKSGAFMYHHFDNCKMQ